MQASSCDRLGSGPVPKSIEPAQSPVANMIFSLLTFSVSIPSAVKVFNWLTTMYKGSISLATPMMHALSFLLLFTIGGLTGLFLGTLATDIPLHDTYFVVAHFHYVMMGGTFVAFLGALYYWWPKMFGRMYNEFWGRIAAVGVFIGFNLTFFPQFIAGSQGMPRRYFDYLPQFTVYHQWSTVGAFVLGGSILIAALNLLSSLRNGAKAPANPWGSPGLEWVAASPPSHYNFDEDVPGRERVAVEVELLAVARDDGRAREHHVARAEDDGAAVVFDEVVTRRQILH